MVSASQPHKDDWSRAALVQSGFGGWFTFSELANQLSTLTQAGGVYVVVAPGESVGFRDSNPGGWFKGRDPSVEAPALQANWVRGAEVVYIGKANNLRQRLRQYMRFGEGRPVGHWGGRLIWQLEGSGELVVAWRETPGQIPSDVERQMIDEFRSAYGQPPFANDPQLLGR